MRNEWSILDVLVCGLLLVSFIDMQAQFASVAKSWPSRVLVGCAVLSVVLHVGVYESVASATAMQCCALMALSSLLWYVDLSKYIRNPPPLPYHLLGSFCVCVFPSARQSVLLWTEVGSLDTFSVLCSVLLALLTALALWVWAIFIAKGNYGPFQEYLGDFLTLPLVPVFAVWNALCEEVEYRGIIMGALFAADMNAYTHSWKHILQLRPLIYLALQALLFAMEHYHAGFPSGNVGFGMVFVWGSLLGMLRLYTNGMLLPLTVHIVADAAIGLLLLRPKKSSKRGRKNKNQVKRERM